MIMPRTLGESLKLWQMLAVSIVQIGVGIWWIAGQAAEIRDLRRASNANTADLVTLSRDVVRIDVEGSRVWALRRPEEIKNSDKLDAKLTSIEDRFTTLDRQMVRLLALAEQRTQK